MPQRLVPCFLAVLLSVTSGCTGPAETNQRRVAEAYVSDSGSVGFDIIPRKGEHGSLHFEARYPARNRLAKFEIEFGSAQAVENDSRDFPLKTGQGRFVAETGSDATVLLSDLQKALEGKKNPGKVQRAKTLPFTCVNIGDNLSQASGGGFNGNPPGNWTAIKIFIGDGEQEGEVFLNINTAIGKGQFSIKDPDYGDLVIKQLATVL
jgi:hypothetical protein